MPENPMKSACALILACFASQSAAALTQWDFNSDDGNAATGTLAPSLGAGSLALIGGATDLFTFGSPNDPAAAPLDSSWSVGGYPAQGTASGTAGFESFLSTAGFHHISVSFDFRNQPSANKWFALQASADHGAVWNDVAVFGVSASDTWFTQSFDISSALPAADDNPQFGFRIVAVFAPSTSAYEASEAGYNPAFGLQYDLLTVNAEPVPEPAAPLMLAAGAAAMALSWLARRRAGTLLCAAHC
jgi:hypothetical protein